MQLGDLIRGFLFCCVVFRGQAGRRGTCSCLRFVPALQHNKGNLNALLFYVHCCKILQGHCGPYKTESCQILDWERCFIYAGHSESPPVQAAAAPLQLLRHRSSADAVKWMWWEAIIFHDYANRNKGNKERKQLLEVRNDHSKETMRLYCSGSAAEKLLLQSSKHRPPAHTCTNLHKYINTVCAAAGLQQILKKSQVLHLCI